MPSKNHTISKPHKKPTRREQILALLGKQHPATWLTSEAIALRVGASPSRGSNAAGNVLRDLLAEGLIESRRTGDGSLEHRLCRERHE